MTINVKKHVEITDDMARNIARNVYWAIQNDTDESFPELVLEELEVDYADDDDARNIYLNSLDSEEEDKQLLETVKKEYLKFAMEHAEDDWYFCIASC